MRWEGGFQGAWTKALMLLRLVECTPWTSWTSRPKNKLHWKAAKMEKWTQDHFVWPFIPFPGRSSLRHSTSAIFLETTWSQQNVVLLCLLRGWKTELPHPGQLYVRRYFSELISWDLLVLDHVLKQNPNWTFSFICLIFPSLIFFPLRTHCWCKGLGCSYAYRNLLTLASAVSSFAYVSFLYQVYLPEAP